MNKKILAAGLVLAMLSTGTSIFAAESDIMPISNDEPVVNLLENKSAVSKEMVTVGEEGLEISDDVLLYDNKGEKIEKEEIKKDSQVIVFKSEEKTIAVILVRENSPSSADLDLYDVSDSFGDLVNAKNDLALHINDEIDITNLDGEKVSKDELAGKNLLVFYTQVALSLPGQTTPEKIIVLGENEKADEEEKTYEHTFTVDAEKVRKDGDVVMLPLRSVSEGLGYEVGWSDELQKITVGTVPMGVNFVLGENKYNKSRMTPFTLEKAPEMVIFGDYGVTYVPASFFTEILWAEVVENEDGTVIVRQ